MLITRRHITKGPNFDIVVGIDLHDTKEIEGLWNYMRTRKPACGIISTPCTGLKGFSGLNRAIHREGWDKSRQLSVPLGELGGQVALFQLRNDAHFIAENPQGSELWELPSWEKVLAHPRTKRCVVHQCMTNLRDPENKLRIKKPTDFVASDEALLKNLRPMVRCKETRPFTSRRHIQRSEQNSPSQDMDMGVGFTHSSRRK